jgi:hypothetical protein
VLASAEQRDAGERGVPLGVMGCQAQRLPTSLDREPGLADQRHRRGRMGEHIGIVRVELERSQQLPAGAVIVAAVELRDPEHAVRAVVAIVELDRLARQIERLLAQEEPVVPGEAGPFVEIGHRQPDVGTRELRVLGDRRLEAAAGIRER